MRTLASVQKIVSLEPIPNADRIEKAIVLGWECIVAKKDDFKVGDLVVYIEIDSVVPDLPIFEFLRERKFRVRTIRLRGQISQGLVISPSILPKGKWKEGDDVTNILKVKKYDPEGELEQKLLEERLQRNNSKVNKFLLKYPWYRKLTFKPKKASFPSFIKKTDEIRIQALPWICQKEKDTKFFVTEKLDGQSATYFLVKNKRFLWFGNKYLFGVCSRNLYLPKKNDSNYWKIAELFNINSVLENLIGDAQFIILQGEILGTGIQANKYKIQGLDFYGFNLIYPDHKLNSVEMKKVLDKYAIKTVPILDTEFKLRKTITKMVDFSIGKSTLLDIQREGVVIRNYEKNISFKVINPEFLLTYEEK